MNNNILPPGFEPSTSVSKTDILANRPICSMADIPSAWNAAGEVVNTAVGGS